MACQIHDGQQPVIVCVTCGNKLLCPECLDNHTEGHVLQSFKKVASQIQEQMKELSANYSQHLSDISQDIRDTQTVLKEQDLLERQACDKINAQRQLLHKAIDESADNLVEICKQRKEKNHSALQIRENLLLSQNAEITNNQSEITKLLQSKNFAEVIKTSKSVKSIKVEDIPPTPLESYDIHTSEINKQSVDNMLGQMTDTPADDDVSDFLGSLRLQPPVSLSTSQNAGSDSVGSVRSEGEFTTVSTINSNTSDSSYAVVIHPSVPGHAWVRWYKQKEIQLTDRQGHVTQTIKFKKVINGMTTTPDNRLLVCGEKDIYQVVYGSEPSVYFNTTLFPYDIYSTDSGDLFVSMMDSAVFTTTQNSRRIVSKYNSKGQHLSDSAEYDSFGDRLFIRPWRLSVNNTTTTVVVINITSFSPSSSHLVVLDASLKLKLRFDGKVTPANKKYTPSTDAKFYIWDVTFTPECNILVAEQYSKSILLLDRDCQLLKTLWKDELPPTALCLHNDGELWFGFFKEVTGTAVIKVIKPSTRT